MSFEANVDRSLEEMKRLKPDVVESWGEAFLQDYFNAFDEMQRDPEYNYRLAVFVTPDQIQSGNVSTIVWVGSVRFEKNWLMMYHLNGQGVNEANQPTNFDYTVFDIERIDRNQFSVGMEYFRRDAISRMLIMNPAAGIMM